MNFLFCNFYTFLLLLNDLQQIFLMMNLFSADKETGVLYYE